MQCKNGGVQHSRFFVNVVLQAFSHASIGKIDVFDVGYKSIFWKLAFLPFFVRVATQFSRQTFFARGIVFQNLQRQGFSIQIWQSHSVATSVSGVFEFMANQRLKIYVFAVFRACGNVISMANIFCCGFVSQNLQYCMSAMQFLRESCFFAVKIVLYCLYGTGKFANKT